jgi:hypothetical protein
MALRLPRSPPQSGRRSMGQLPAIMGPGGQAQFPPNECTASIGGWDSSIRVGEGETLSGSVNWTLFHPPRPVSTNVCCLLDMCVSTWCCGYVPDASFPCVRVYRSCCADPLLPNGTLNSIVGSIECGCSVTVDGESNRPFDASASSAVAH